MSIRAFVIAIVCISAAAIFWPRAQQPTPSTNAVSSGPVAQEAVRQEAAGARTYSASHPLLTASGNGGLRDMPAPESTAKPAAPRVVAQNSPAKEDTAVRPVASDLPAKRISSTKPGDAEAREQLVRDIQYELRRAGCYDGEIHGAWNNSTRQAMQTFTQRMNATLPVDQPDYILLTLLQAQRPQSCKSGCPAGQVADGGRCLPRAIVAQQQQGGTHIATSGQQTLQPSPALSTSQDPLPGRMSAGAPMVGQDLPIVPQAHDSAASAMDGTRSHTGQVRPPPPRHRPSGYAQKGSTRQVFVNTMRSAP